MYNSTDDHFLQHTVTQGTFACQVCTSASQVSFPAEETQDVQKQEQQLHVGRSARPLPSL